ncbi:MAG: formyltransferase family protein, partial [Paludibacter sp.]
MKGNDNTAVLLMHCPDRPGILAVVTEFINQHKGNILYLDQYVNREEKVFFMRVKWELDAFEIPKEKIEEYFQTLIGIRFNVVFRLYFSDTKPRMAIFVSKMSHCLYDLLARYAADEWHVEIPLIISNHPDMESVAKRFDIPYYIFPITKENKAEQEALQLELLKKNQVTFCVLARYMQVLSVDFIRH